MAAGLAENVAQRVITGIFECCAAALCEQDLCGQPQRVLCAQSDQDLLWPRGDTAAWQGVTGDEFDQLRIVLVVVVGGQRGEVALPQSLQRAKPPVGVVKQRRIGLSINKRIAVFGPVLRLAGGGPAGELLANRAVPVDRIRRLWRGFKGRGRGRVF